MNASALTQVDLLRPRDSCWLAGLESSAAGWPLDQARLERLCKLPLAVGFRFEWFGTRAAYAIVQRRGNRAELLRLLVSRHLRRRGIGRGCLAWIIEREREIGLAKILSHVRELDVDSQLFLKACGFKATATIDGYFQRRGHGGALLVAPALQFTLRLDRKRPRGFAHFGRG